MINIIKRIKDIIEILRNPTGEPIGALEILFADHEGVMSEIDPEMKPYVKNGDFLLMFENDYITIVPRKDFFKYYEFTETPNPKSYTPVRQIRPL